MRSNMIYVSLSDLFCGLLWILGAVALVYLIIVLRKVYKLLSKAESMLDANEGNINSMMKTLPKASSNIAEMSENLKDVSGVITETAASAIVAKENLDDYLTTFKDIVAIIRKVFFK